MTIFVPILSIIVGLLMLLAPCMIAYVLIKKLIKKDEKNSDLELRVHMLEQELEEIKSHIGLLDEL